MKITITDVARVAKVSKASVSAVINNKPTVSPKTREKILKVIKKLNYRPNEVARSLSSRKTKSFGLVIKEIDNPYFARVMKGVFDVCCELGYTVLLGSSELSPAQEFQSIETLTNQRVDGLIISPLQGADSDFSYLSDLIHDHYPLVMLGEVKNYTTSFVDVDNVNAAHQAVSYLIKLGHTEIAYFSGPAYSVHSFDRLQGYQQAHIDHNLPIHKDFIIEVGSYIENGFQAGKKLFSRQSKTPSAVFCYNDLVAIGLINALIESNINVPDQVSVIGFDDIDICGSIKIPLTTIHVPAYEIGRKASELLIRQIQNSDQLLNEKIILKTRLVERNSCTKR
ncbi:MAG: LacI family DNA-binding transcriptional regulator [bacterium]|nr:LacI family DNA-binding transcriptional regulator [bacterium]